MIKGCNLHDILLVFANKLLHKSLKFEQQPEIEMIPLPKSGDLSQPMNYRGKGISSVTAKLVNKII